MAQEAPEDNNREQQAMDGLERMRAYWARAEREDDDIRLKRWKTAGKMALIFLGCAVLIYGAKLLQTAYIHVRDQNRLNETTAQISQLVENIRQAHTARGKNFTVSTYGLIKSGAVPSSMVGQNNELRNVFGGKVVVANSLPTADFTPTFKLSYQGLPHKICVALAQMDWGTSVQGLQAVALGVADEEGHDKALADIDRQIAEAKPQRIQNEAGQWILVQPQVKYPLNVARPNDRFRPTPFVEEDAVAGCACGNKNYCSFALRYAF